MADNYLERRMEDYRSGRLSAPANVTPTSTRRVFIIGTDFDRIADLVRQYRLSGCRTAFTCIDAKRGMALAQSTGSQCHHLRVLDNASLDHSLAYISRHWGGIDEIIDLRDTAPSFE
ncbi:MAG: hypothetical protein J6C77_00875 [Muribaculaceae bacterium]|nr:hypothetical protein [Muribaculaceae bacterium]